MRYTVKTTAYKGKKKKKRKEKLHWMRLTTD